jgi:hypothetical protein
MRDKRPVDELSVEELERILAIKKREERQQKLKRMERSGRIVSNGKPDAPAPSIEKAVPTNISHRAVTRQDSGRR